jgi:hypothetical protein
MEAQAHARKRDPAPSVTPTRNTQVARRRRRRGGRARAPEARSCAVASSLCNAKQEPAAQNYSLRFFFFFF